jgi:hypothetical protein
LQSPNHRYYRRTPSVPPQPVVLDILVGGDEVAAGSSAGDEVGPGSTTGEEMGARSIDGDEGPALAADLEPPKKR